MTPPLSNDNGAPSGLSRMAWLGIALSLFLVAYIYFWNAPFVYMKNSLVYWLMHNWSINQDYEHGWIIPFISLYLLVHALKRLNKKTLRGSLHGLWLLILYGMFYYIAIRSQQPRIILFGLPFLLTGLAWYYAGYQVARTCLVPFFFLLLCIPLPGLQQATVGMQLMATQISHYFAAFFGVETVVQGTEISSATGSWNDFSIAEGCSGIRSLMALFMISIAWAYLAHPLSMWKRLTLAISALPISILANAFRIGSIFILAEYVSPTFAGKTWHDWSGMLLFFPASLICLTLLHTLLAGQLPLLHRRDVIVRRHNQEPTSK